MAPNLAWGRSSESVNIVPRLLRSLTRFAFVAGAAVKPVLEKPIRRLGERILDVALEGSTKSTGDRFTQVVPATSSDVATYRDPFGPGVFRTAPPARDTGR
jgi:hypothetical protein